MSAVNLNVESFNRMVLEEKKTTIVDFGAPWCSYCRRIDPAYQKIAESRDDIVVAKVDIDDCPELAEKYGIEVIPTMVIFINGIPGESIVAPESKAKIESFIDENLEA